MPVMCGSEARSPRFSVADFCQGVLRHRRFLARNRQAIDGALDDFTSAEVNS